MKHGQRPNYVGKKNLVRGKSLYNCRFLNPTPDLLNQNVLGMGSLEAAFKKICLEEFKFENLFPMCVSFFSIEVKGTKSSQCCHFFNYYLTGKNNIQERVS